MPRFSAISLKDITDAASRLIMGTRNFAVGGITIGTTKTKLTLTNTLQYCIGGLMYTKAGTADLFVHAATNPAQAAGSTCYYLVTLDAAGTGGVITAGTATTLPVIPDGACPVGILKVVCDSTHTFTPGTTAHDAAGVTAAYTDISVVPLTLP